MEENTELSQPDESGQEAAVETASAEQVEQQPEEQQQETKTFSQEELDRIVEKRLAKERRKYERQQQQEPPKQPESSPLDPQQFASPEEYAEALAERKAVEKMAALEREKMRRQLDDQYQDRLEEAYEKYADFDQVAGNPALHITEVMAIAIKASDVGPDVQYHLGKNPKEALRIANLPPLLQAREIGKLEAKLSHEAERPKVSAAPEPIKPIGNKGQGKKAVEDMTDDEFFEHRRKYKASRG